MGVIVIMLILTICFVVGQRQAQQGSAPPAQQMYDTAKIGFWMLKL